MTEKRVNVFWRVGDGKVECGVVDVIGIGKTFLASSEEEEISYVIDVRLFGDANPGGTLGNIAVGGRRRNMHIGSKGVNLKEEGVEMVISEDLQVIAVLGILQDMEHETIHEILEQGNNAPDLLENIRSMLYSS